MSGSQSEADVEAASTDDFALNSSTLDTDINEWIRQTFDIDGNERSCDDFASDSLATSGTDISHYNATNFSTPASSHVGYGWSIHQEPARYQPMTCQPLSNDRAMYVQPLESRQAAYTADTSLSASSHDLQSYSSYGITSQRSASFPQMTTAHSQNTHSETPSSWEHMSDQMPEPNSIFSYPENIDTSRTGSDLLQFIGSPNENPFTPFVGGSDITHNVQYPTTQQRETIFNDLFVGESDYQAPSDYFESASSSNLENRRRRPIRVDADSSGNDQPAAKLVTENKLKRKSIARTPEKQARVNEMRKMKACLRCRSFHKECDDGMPCTRCKVQMSGARTYFEPCFRDDLGNAVVSRHGNTEFGQFNIQFEQYRWDKTSIASDVKIIWRLPGDNDAAIALPPFECRRFILAPNSKPHEMEYNANGTIVKIELPLYAATANQQLNLIISKFLDDSRSVILDCIVASLPDELSIITFKEAIRYESRSEVVYLALSIRCAAYCSEGGGIVDGDQPFSNEYPIHNERVDTGYTKIDKSYGRAVPLSIDHQIDVVMLQRVQRLQKTLLKSLSKMILAKDKRKVRRSWYEVYLATFIILSNLEWVHGSAWSYFQILKNTSQESFARDMLSSFIEEFDISANNILHHFRHILRGADPFQAVDEDPGKFRADTGVDQEAIHYIQRAMKLREAAESAEIPERIVLSATGELQQPNGRWLSLLFARLHL